MKPGKYWPMAAMGLALWVLAIVAFVMLLRAL